MRRVALVLLALAAAGVVPADSSARDSALAARLRDEIRAAVALAGLGPGDLAVRDVELWETRGDRLRERGVFAGDFALPGETDPLRPPLVDRALRHPLQAVSLGAELLEGAEPDSLRGLTGPRLRRPGKPPPTRSLVEWLTAVEDRVRRALPPVVERGSLPAWLLDGIGPGDVGRARTAFDRFAGFDARGFADEIGTLLDLLESRRGELLALRSPKRVEMSGGRLLIVGTPGDDVHEEDAWLIIEPGGSDVYRNNAGGVRRGPGAAMVIDLAGDDRYEADGPFAQGAALLGVGILVDCSGNDTYVGTDFCQGAAAGGLGILLDLGGDDAYSADRFAQGAGAFGYGILRDEGAGHDRYRVERLGQGLGRTAGHGLLVDDGGDDRYVAGTKYEWFYSQWTNGRTVHWSFAQGCGFGFFCRYRQPGPDGEERLVTREMFPGGVGLLADHGGDDVYSGSMYAQGTAYFYGLGILVDHAGNDRYRATWYGQGAAPHYAAGILVDGAGDDEYVGMHQVQANGRDFSTAVLLDLGGDDRYVGEDRVQGCGDLADGYGIFVDLAGDDRYRAERKSARGWATNADPDRQPTRGRP